MKITQHNIPIRSLVENFSDTEESGAIGFDGKLTIRPSYQREFVYNDKQQQSVINSIRKELPLGVMYWSSNEDGTFEVLDGQQRTMSICRYVTNGFSVDFKRFFNLSDEEKNQILDYELLVFICDGTKSEKLDWFRTINIAGLKLTDQELLNAAYTGAWLLDAKRQFSKTNCTASVLGKDLVKGSPIRQDLLETALSWISNGNISEYMSAHQHDENADELWNHYRRVINWVKSVFPIVRKEMASVNWGDLYREFGGNHYDADELEEKIKVLLQDEDVTKISGIYTYLLKGEEKALSIRSFSPKMKVAAFTRQKGVCAHCGGTFDIKEMEADHITPWSKGGKTDADNCQCLCVKCNRTKSAK